jgi:hypothetical protein
VTEAVLNPLSRVQVATRYWIPGEIATLAMITMASEQTIRNPVSEYATERMETQKGLMTFIPAY